MKNDITPISIQQQQPIVKTTGVQQRRYITTTGAERLEKINGANPFEKPTKMLLSLLRGALNDEPVEMDSFKGANYADWKNLLHISQEASVTGMACDAASKLPQGTIPKDISMKMLQIQKESETRHGQQEKIIGELSEMYDKKGIETVQLKGVGLSMNYPEPKHRFGGDIDIFTRLKGTQTSGYSNSYEMVDNMMADAGLEVENHRASKKTKHSEFDYKGVRIENHHYFINKERIPEAGKIDAFLHKSLNPHAQILPNGTKILVPSKEFNSVFLAHHAYQHFVFGGIDLHHLTDWGTHIKKNGLQLPEEVKGTRFEQFAFALTNLSNRYLGTNVKVPENKKFENDIFETLLHPEEPEFPKDLNPAEVILYKCKRFIKRASRAKEYTGEPVSKAFMTAVWNKIFDPKSLLKKI